MWDPLCLVHCGACVWQSPHILDGQHQQFGGLQSLHTVLVADVQETVSIHVQDLITDLSNRRCSRIIIKSAFKSDEQGY